LVEIEIVEGTTKDMPFKKNGWNFNWRLAIKTKGAKTYVLRLKSLPSEIQGVLQLREVDEMLIMNLVELAPWNIGRTKKRYDYVAGCLIAFACREAFKLNSNYQGFLTFESKTSLMNLRSKEFSDLKLFIADKAESQSEEEKLQIELMSLQIMMEDYLEKDITKSQLISTGEFVRLFLEKLNIRQNRFAEYIGIRPSNFNKLLSGDRKINLEVSMMLSSIFKVAPEIWLNIQTKNDLVSLTMLEKKQYTKFKLRDLVSRK